MKNLLLLPMILLFSTDITTALALLQNEVRDYWSQLKPILLDISAALTAIGDSTTGDAVALRVNSIGNEQIINWSDLKPTLVLIKDALISKGETVLGAAIDAQLQQIPNDNNQVYADQVKPIIENIVEALANLGQ